MHPRLIFRISTVCQNQLEDGQARRNNDIGKLVTMMNFLDQTLSGKIFGLEWDANNENLGAIKILSNQEGTMAHPVDGRLFFLAILMIAKGIKTTMMTSNAHMKQ